MQPIVKEYYKKVLDLLRKHYGRKAKDNLQLEHICREIIGSRVPVTPWDQYKGEKRAIINTDDHKHKGVHWVGVVMVGKRIYFYDSFARKSTHILRKFDEKWATKGYHITDAEKVPDQQGYQEDCGLRCVAWLFLVKLLGVGRLLE